jgi:Restriction endonuclease
MILLACCRRLKRRLWSLLSIDEVRSLEDDFAAVFDSHDAELYRDQLLAISNYERLLKTNGPLANARARSSRIPLSKAEQESIQHKLQVILEHGDAALKTFICSRINVCHRHVQLHEQLAKRYAIIPVGALHPGVVQFNAEFDTLIRALCSNPTDMYNLRARQFEELVAELWARMGYGVELTPETHDGGRDIIASKSSETNTQVLIECKKYSAGRPVGR